MSATPVTADLLAGLREQQRQDAAHRAAVRLEREREARQQFVTRSGVGYDALVTTYRTLRELSKINLSDLRVPPGFNLLPDGEVGSVNADTPEWQFWNMLSQHAEDADHLFHVLLRAADELKVAGHWDTGASE